MNAIDRKKIQSVIDKVFNDDLQKVENRAVLNRLSKK